LESALAQTWENKEIIFVDDGSTDVSLTIARAFEPQGINVISQPNKGASAARNQALKEAQGDFIQYLDADDLLAPDKIECQVVLLNNQENLNCVASGEWARFYKRPAEAQFVPQPLWTDMAPADWLICVLENHWMMHPAAWLVPRSLAEAAGNWNESLSLDDDGEYFCRIVLASQGIKFCWGAKSYYRSGLTSSLSGSRSRSAWESALRSLKLSTQHLLSVENSTRSRHACATALQRFVYEAYPHVPDLQQQAAALVQQWGGSTVKPIGGPLFHLLATGIGWKQAKRVQQFVYRYGYRRVAIGGKVANFIQLLKFQNEQHQSQGR
jgi:hypothetical protein